MSAPSSRPIRELDDAHPAPAAGPMDVLAAAGIDDTRDLDADALEVRGRGIPRGVRGEDDGALAGFHRPQIDQPPDAGRQHDAGQIVAGEDVGSLDQPGAHDERPCAHLPETLEDTRHPTLHDRDPVVVVAPGDDRVDDDLDARRRRDRAPQVGERREVGSVAPAQMPAELGLLLDQQHASARLGGRERRCHPRRPAAGY